MILLAKPTRFNLQFLHIRCATGTPRELPVGAFERLQSAWALAKLYESVLKQIMVCQTG